MISRFVRSSPASGSVLTAQSLELLQIPCLPLSWLLPCSRSVSLCLLIICSKFDILISFTLIITIHQAYLILLHPWLFLFKNFLMFIHFLRDRERQSMSREGTEREGDTESEASPRHWAVSTVPDAGLELTDCEIMTWAEVGHSTDWATQAPLIFLYSWERDRVWAGEEHREREGERESQAGSTLSAEPDTGLNLTTVKSWPELKSRVGHSTDWATQVPLCHISNSLLSFKQSS